MTYRYSVEPVAGFWVPSSWDSKPSVRLKMTPFASKLFKPAKPTETFQISQYGETLEHSTGHPGVDAWILSLRARRARATAQQAPTTRPRLGTAVTSGKKRFASFARLIPNSSSWKTSQVCLLSKIDTPVPFSETWPPAGMICDGIAYQRLTLAETIDVTVFGCLRKRPKDTPANQGNLFGKRVIERRIWPTPYASDVKTYRLKGKGQSTKNSLCSIMRREENGLLNPEFAEWLMGWPLGWTCTRKDRPALIENLKRTVTAHGGMLSR